MVGLKNMFLKSKINSQGFTLIELLIVVAILGVLATIGLVNFQHSMLRSRDTKRKSDLAQIQRAIEMYYNDYGTYPTSSGTGLILNLAWGSEFIDIKETLYMKQLPIDPTQNTDYCYSSSGIAYQIYAKLENSQDAQCLDDNCATATLCGGGGKTYNYGVASPNSKP